MTTCTNCAFLEEFWHEKPVCKKAKCLDCKESLKMYDKVRVNCPNWRPMAKNYKTTAEWTDITLY